MKNKHNTSIKRAALAVAAIVALLSTGACNQKADPYDYDASTNVSVTSFSLKADKKVMSNLDSVFFSIDLKKGVIFNADSLPVGTDVTRLIPVISYNSLVSEVTLTMTEGTVRTGTVDYKTNPYDSIDFSGKVMLHVVAEDLVTARDYELKVNVHKMQPDSLVWDQMALTKLPTHLAGEPKDQKTVLYKGYVVTLIREADNSLTIATTDDPMAGNWTKKASTIPADAVVRSFTATDDALYFLTPDGSLHSYAFNPESPASESEELLATRNYTSIIGGYGSQLLTLRREGSKYYHSVWPETEAAPDVEVASGFPVEGTSNFNVFSNKWSDMPIGFILGGITADGRYNVRAWGYDGNVWTDMSVNTPPALVGATVVPYYTYRQTSQMWKQDEISTWILIGGRKPDGALNRDVYVSYDTGVNWVKAKQYMQLPEYVPGMAFTDNVVISSPMSGTLGSNWTSKPAMELPAQFRLVYTVNGYDVDWECPYIYMFGGTDASGKLYNTIWRGVLNRLTFVPLM